VVESPHVAVRRESTPAERPLAVVNLPMSSTGSRSAGRQGRTSSSLRRGLTQPRACGGWWRGESCPDHAPPFDVGATQLGDAFEEADKGRQCGRRVSTRPFVYVKVRPRRNSPTVAAWGESSRHVGAGATGAMDHPRRRARPAARAGFIQARPADGGTSGLRVRGSVRVWTPAATPGRATTDIRVGGTRRRNLRTGDRCEVGARSTGVVASTRTGRRASGCP